MNAQSSRKSVPKTKTSSTTSKTRRKVAPTRVKSTARTAPTLKTTKKPRNTRNTKTVASDGKTPRNTRKKLPDEIKWRVWPAGERPWLTVFASFVVVFTVLFFGFRIHLWAGALAFIVLFAMLNPFFIPTSYEMNKKELLIHKFYYTDKREWKMFRRFFLTRSGVVLSTFSKRKKFLDNFRGVQLLLPRKKEERDKILDYLESKLELDSDQSRQ